MTPTLVILGHVWYGIKKKKTTQIETNTTNKTGSGSKAFSLNIKQNVCLLIIIIIIIIIIQAIAQEEPMECAMAACTVTTMIQ